MHTYVHDWYGMVWYGTTIPYSLWVWSHKQIPQHYHNNFFERDLLWDMVLTSTVFSWCGARARPPQFSWKWGTQYSTVGVVAIIGNKFEKFRFSLYYGLCTDFHRLTESCGKRRWARAASTSLSLCYGSCESQYSTMHSMRCVLCGTTMGFAAVQ